MTGASAVPCPACVRGGGGCRDRGMLTGVSGVPRCSAARKKQGRWPSSRRQSSRSWRCLSLVGKIAPAARVLPSLAIFRWRVAPAWSESRQCKAVTFA
jgi:hypothetical protein